MDINKVIDDFVKKDERPLEIGRYHPSAIGGCMRRVWYDFKFPVPLSMETAKIFEMGNIIHEFMKKVFEKENSELELINNEAHLSYDLQDFLISGRLDNVIQDRKTGKYYVVEIKSSNNIDKVIEPWRSNESQIQIYMHISGIHNGILVYVDKNNLASKTFEVEYSKEKAELIIEKVRMLHKHLLENTIPNIIKDDANCRFCPHVERCMIDTNIGGV